MTLAIKSSHILEAEKMAEKIYGECPVKQQEMLEALKDRLVTLNRDHLQIIKR